MMRLIQLFIQTVLLAFVIIAGSWYLRTPQPIGQKAQYEYLKDTAIYSYHDLKRATNLDEFQYWLPLANGGNSVAEIKVAELLFIKGTEDARAYQRAVSLLNKASNKGIPDAQNALGVAYRNGLGIPEDKIKAFKWFTLASRQGVGLAHRNLETLTPELTPEELAAAEKEVDIWYAKYREKF